ncbi:MAG: acyloxyacyl hydrolase [Desulfurivibrionaceae bacterium]|nr:acyloxyacyl hydrolase [Desulfobulbales bacterium]MDT8334445.1 acyloxyacyl hydrolase [Desulfurivibrionaceae bacterium]
MPGPGPSAAIIAVLAILLAGPVPAGERGFGSPERLGIGLTLGHSYDPSPTFGLLQIGGFLQYDYDRLWPHPAPEPLFFKMEGNLGLVDYEGNARLLASANILAQYYLAAASRRWRPYVEAGIGLIYSDFQVEGQGLRLNFNPQAGIGCDRKSDSGAVWYGNFRIHHLSNGDLHRDNRGVNSVLIQFGRYF